MKKITFLMCAVLACLFANAQEPKFVSTEQQKRNVLIEEFTGRDCGYCPMGQKAVNEMMAANPGRVFSANIHKLGFMSTTAAPNLNTEVGGTLFGTFGVSGIPAASINRSLSTVHPADPSAQDIVNAQLNQVAEVNVGGKVLINPETRIATIMVEAYYTADSRVDKNYLNVMMTQDSILGSQNGGSYFNPEQMIGNMYVHMHTFRDLITELQGDEITTTKAGTLVTRTYTYEIPEVIGVPNGVEVDLNNIHFLAFVTEQPAGLKSAPILNVTSMQAYMATGEKINPIFGDIKFDDKVTCSETKTASIEVINVGTKEITSLRYEIEVYGVTTTHVWEGSLPPYSSIIIEKDIDVYVGEREVKFRMTQANWQFYKQTKKVHFVSEDWTEAYFQSSTDEFKIALVQDKFGNQTTWELINSNGDVLASGGPYSTLAASGIKQHVTKVNVPNNECIKFVIRDEAGNGINNGAGEGYYKISDSKGNVIVEGDGKFEKEMSHIISTRKGYVAVEEMTEETSNIYPNPVKDVLTIEGKNLEQVNVYNTMGQLVKSVNCNDNTVKVNVNDLQNGMYIVNVIDNNGTLTSSKVSVLK